MILRYLTDDELKVLKYRLENYHDMLDTLYYKICALYTNMLAIYQHHYAEMGAIHRFYHPMITSLHKFSGQYRYKSKPNFGLYFMINYQENYFGDGIIHRGCSIDYCCIYGGDANLIDRYNLPSFTTKQIEMIDAYKNYCEYNFLHNSCKERSELEPRIKRFKLLLEKYADHPVRLTESDIDIIEYFDEMYKHCEPALDTPVNIIIEKDEG